MVHDNLKKEEINQPFLISVIIIILITNTFTILSQICHLTLWKYDGMRWEILMNTKDCQTANYSDTDNNKHLKHLRPQLEQRGRGSRSKDGLLSNISHFYSIFACIIYLDFILIHHCDQI